MSNPSQVKVPCLPLSLSASWLLCAVLPAAAQDAAPKAAEPAPPDAPPSIVIFGQGQTRQVQNITRSDLAKALPGTSPLKTLEKLPGVSFQSADALGAYEWSTRFSVRGFSQGQLGFTLDNVPLGNMSYGNNNGLHISRAISPENVGQVDLSQGAGAVGTASTSNLGGTVQFISSNPADSFGANGAQTFGSYNTMRTFVRLDTGLFNGGTKAYLSLARQRAHKWKGEGPQDQDQFNSKLVHSFGENKFSFFYNRSDRSENDYQDMSLDMLNRLGWDWDNYAPDWQRALDAAHRNAQHQSDPIYRGNVTTLDDAYYTARGLRIDNLAGATLELAITPALSSKTTLYHHDNDGQGHWYTPYTESPTVPISIRTTEYAIDRYGITSDLSWEWDKHTINGGFWYEHNIHTLTRNFYAITGPADTNYFLTNPMLTGFKQVFTTRTVQFYLQDTLLMLDDKLKLNAGFKSPHVNIDATSINAARAGGTLNASKTLLPQLGLSFDLNSHDEVFTSISRNLRAFEPGVYGQFSQSQAAFDANGYKLKPETSISIDLGYRFKRGSLTGSVATYRADFSDRLLSVATCSGVVGCPNTVVNVGKVLTTGVEAATVWTMTRQWNWFNALTYNDSTYKSDYLDSGVLVPVSGKQVVDSPKLMLNTELSWEDPSWFARGGAKYTDKRYYTFVNDGQVPAFWVMNLSGGYKQKSFAGLKDVTISLHLNNVLNKRYFATIGSNQFVKSDPHGEFATLLVGAPRELFFTINGRL
ncbi:MAG: TonB-dependent receptor [Pseudomonadota bacterium]